MTTSCPRSPAALLCALLLCAGITALGPAAVAGPGVPGGPPGPGGRPGTAVAPSGTWPLSPAPDVARDFAPPLSRWGPGHRGVDLRGTVGQQVRAARAGTVTFAGRLAGRGVVVVSHGDTRTTYEPVAASVEVGDRVREGGAIGALELLGSHCLPAACLHWGLLEGERYLDPLTLVGVGPVRLLPWLGIAGTGATGPTNGGRSLVPQLPSWRPAGDAALFRA